MLAVSCFILKYAFKIKYVLCTKLIFSRSNEIDLYMDDSPILEYALSKIDNNCSVKYAAHDFGETAYGFGLPKGSWLKVVVPYNEELSFFAYGKRQSDRSLVIFFVWFLLNEDVNKITVFIAFVSSSFPADTRRKNDVVLTSMRRDYVASTSIRRYFGTKCPLGFLFHQTNAITV